MYRQFDAYNGVLALCVRDRFAAWSALEHKTGKLLGCGIVKPFAEVDRSQRVVALKKAIQNMWQTEMGHSRNPMVLAIEQRDIITPESPNQIKSLLEHATLMGMCIESFRAYRFYAEKKENWMFTNNQDYFEARVLDNLTLNEKKKLVQAVQDNGKQYRGPVFQSIAFGRWTQKRYKIETAHHEIFKVERNRLEVA